MSTHDPSAIDHIDPEVFVTYLTKTRWFGGKGRPFEVSRVRRVGDMPGQGEGPRVSIHLVELAYGDAEGGSELYQVPLAFYTEPQERLDHAFVGWWEEPGEDWVHAYDALHDREAMAAWLRAFGAADPGATVTDQATGLSFHRLPGHELDLEAQSTLFTGEQSNSSVAFREDSLMKVFRKVTPGRNPDVEVHEVLTRAGLEHVADLYGWVDWSDPGSPGGEVLQLAMLQQFLRTATDG